MGVSADPGRAGPGSPNPGGGSGADGGAGDPLVIWGAGAMGGSIGAALVEAGQDVLFVDQARDHLEAMNANGLRITGPVMDATVPAEAVHPDEVQGTFSTIFLCVKAHHTKEATDQLAPHLAADGVVVSIQNGLCELEIAQVVGQARTMGAFVNFGADYLKPGIIHRGNRGAVVVGELDGMRTRRVEDIHSLLKTFEPDAVLTDNIFGYLWGKLAYAALLFATALTDESISDVLASTRHRTLLRAIGREVVGVAVARGVTLQGFDGFDPGAFRPVEFVEGDGTPKAGTLQGYPPDTGLNVRADARQDSRTDGWNIAQDPPAPTTRNAAAPTARADASLDDLVAFNRASAKTHSGIWRDLAVRKRRTEVDAQLGPVVRMGEEVGVDTPLTEAIIRQIHEIENGERPQVWENLDELAGLMNPSAGDGGTGRGP